MEEVVATDIIIELLEQLLDKSGTTDTSKIEEYLDEIEKELGKIEKDTHETQQDVMVIAQTLDHPALTTPFADYTVSEALLLFLLLSVFITACARMLRGGLSWLRS